MVSYLFILFNIFPFFLYSIVVTLQTIFPDSAVLRLFSRNLTGICLFAFRSDQSSVSRLGRKLFPANHKWFLESYNHAISCTQNGYIYIETGNDTQLKEKYRIRNFIAPIYSKTNKVDPQSKAEARSDDRSYLQEPIKAIAKKNFQFIYANPNESATF
jgi:hypothetical protein